MSGGYEELVGQNAAAEQPQAAETPPAAEPAAASAPVSEAPPAQPAAEAPQPAAAPEPQDHSVPLNVLLRTREEFGGKLTAAEQRALAAERKLQEIERRRQEAESQAPNVLDDPEGYHAFWENRHRQLEQGFQQRLQQTITRERIESSIDRWSEKLGEEKFSELQKWSATMPPQWVRWAEAQRDPFGVAYKEFEKQQKAKRADELAAKLGDKDLDAWLEERLAERLAQQQPTQPAPQAPAAAQQPRDERGQFASTSQPQRHQPPPLSVVPSAAAPRGEDARGGYDALFKSRG